MKNMIFLIVSMTPIGCDCMFVQTSKLDANGYYTISKGEKMDDSSILPVLRSKHVNSN